MCTNTNGHLGTCGSAFWCTPGQRPGSPAFSTYIDDLCAEITPVYPDINMFLYADDCKICKVITDNSDAEYLQSALSGVCDWATKWKLRINPLKSSHCSFSVKKNVLNSDYTIDGIHLQKVTVQRDLGIMFDSKLTFQHHVLYAKTKAMRALGVLHRFKVLQDTNAIVTFFNSWVVPIFIYEHLCGLKLHHLM